MYENVEISPVAKAVEQYAQKFHKLLFQQDPYNKENFVASPFGAWMLIAIVTAGRLDDYTTQDYETIWEILGMDPAEAYKHTLELLGNPHEDVKSAAGLWIREAIVQEGAIEDWTKQQITDGALEIYLDIPSQEVMDQWASEKTSQLIPSFPLLITEDVKVILATVLATKISWQLPFNITENHNSFWKTKRVLKASNLHKQALVAPKVSTVLHPNNAGNILGVHVASSTHLAVVSVIGEPTADREAILAEAHRIAIEYAETSNLPAIPLTTIENNVGAFYTITTEEKTGYHLQKEEYNTTLPAWVAESEHELSDPAFGVTLSGKPIAQALDETIGGLQIAVANYTRTRFEAAAITILNIRATGFPQIQTETVHTANIEFNGPYAVVAVPIRLRRHQEGEPFTAEELWKGIPVFSAWVNTAAEVPDEDLTDSKQ